MHFAENAELAVALFEDVDVVHRDFHSERWKCFQNCDEASASTPRHRGGKGPDSPIEPVIAEAQDAEALR